MGHCSRNVIIFRSLAAKETAKNILGIFKRDRSSGSRSVSAFREDASRGRRCRARAPTRRTVSIGSPGVPVTCQFPPVGFQLAEMLPMTPIFVPPSLVTRRLAYLFPSAAFSAPLLSRDSRERVCRDDPAQVCTCRLASLLGETNVASPPDTRDVAVASHRVASRRVASRLVSTSSSSSRGCHRQELSTRVKIITLKERIEYGLRIFHTFARGFPSARRPL